MKKLFTIALSLVLTCFLSACGCQAQKPAPTTTAPTTTAPTTKATTPTTASTTAPTTGVTVPSMDTTMETNIPDPEVEPGVTDMTEGAFDNEENGGMNGTENTEDAGAGSRMRR